MSTLSYIEQILQENNAVLVIDDRDAMTEYLKNALLERLENGPERKILIMGMKSASLLRPDFYIQISEKDYNTISELFRTYEFTDSLRIISSNTQYGSMLNYVSTGILSEDEYIDALLY